MLTRTGDESNTLFSERYQQTYHSTFGALTESMHVFLDGAGVIERLHKGQPTRVLEVGFGLGLNCLLCADHAAINKTELHYVGVENDLISKTQLRSLNYSSCLKHPSLVDELSQLIERVRHSEQPVECLSSSDQLDTTQLDRHTSATLLIGDATSSGVQLALNRIPRFDAIFLDAFSPEYNPECWTADFFKQLHSLLSPNGILATYCVKGSVRRNLASAGFSVQKYPGPAGKREVLRAGIDSKRVI